jgi:hypothetical protein
VSAAGRRLALAVPLALLVSIISADVVIRPIGREATPKAALIGPVALEEPPVPEDKPTHHVPTPVGDPATAVIRLERGGCYGACPIYSVELRGNGAVTYQGACNVVVDGRHSYQVPRSEVIDLLRLTKSADFWSLKDRYIYGVTDNPTYTLSVTVGGRTKVVEDYVGLKAGMPKSVADLEDSVDRVAAVQRWLVGDQSTVPALRAEAWDFRGQTAAHTLARAAANAPEAVAVQLLALGAPPIARRVRSDCYPPSQTSAIEAAASGRKIILMRRLISAGALRSQHEKDRALSGSIESGDPGIVREILTFHPDVNARLDESNDTPLLLISQGAHPFTDNDKVQTDYPQITRLLLAAGANPSLADSSGNTPLHATLDAGVAKVLIAGGGPIEARNRDGETPLLATFDEDVAMSLIDAGANVKARTPDGSSIRDIAAAKHWARVLRRLDVRRGA